jgi:hypothetical protein
MGLRAAKSTKGKAQSAKGFVMPWFLARLDQSKLVGLLRPDHRERMFAYFKRHGCIRCSRKRVFYSGNGLCENCTQLIYRRLTVCDKQIREAEAKLPGATPNRFVARMLSARELLSDLAALHKNDDEVRLSKDSLPTEIVFTPTYKSRSRSPLGRPSGMY